MKHLLATAIFALLLTGCVKIQHGEFKYERLGGQKLDDVAIEMPDGTTFMFGKQESESIAPVIDSLTSFINSIKN